MTLRKDWRFTRLIVRQCLSSKDGRTIDELVLSSGFSERAVRDVLNDFRRASRAYIAAWRVRKDEFGVQVGQPRALYVRGKGKDAVRPAPMPRSVYQKHYKDRRKRKAEINAFNRVVSK